MYIVCLDLEGVLVPEIWIEFAKETGIEELKLTTRDWPDYDKLMRHRLAILKEHKLGLTEIKKVIDKISPFPQAKEFLDSLRALTQVLILSDTFLQFASPLMQKLGLPTIFCNSLIADSTGRIVDYKMRCPESKKRSVQALQSIGFEVISAGDSFNDLEMLRLSKKGFLFRSTSAIKEANPNIKALETYDELLEEIKSVLNS